MEHKNCSFFVDFDSTSGEVDSLQDKFKIFLNKKKVWCITFVKFAKLL